MGASTSYDCTVASVAAAFTNVATVTGQGPAGEPVTDSDDAKVDVIGLTVVKTVGVTSVSVGDTVTYTYVITNTGSVPLSDITLTDDKIGTITLPATTLAAGQSMSVTATYVVTAADAVSPPLVNVATAAGKGPSGQPVTAQDDAQIPTVVLQAATTTTAAVSPATLPKTGGQLETGPVSSLAAGLIMIGALLVLTTRRRSLSNGNRLG